MLLTHKQCRKVKWNRIIAECFISWNKCIDVYLNIFSLYNETETLFFSSFQVVSVLGKEEAERKFETLLHKLSHPPSFTTVRVNTHLASVQHVKSLLFDELQKVRAHFCRYVQN